LGWSASHRYTFAEFAGAIVGGIEWRSRVNTFRI
jgi:hypothetical protein